MGHVLMQYQFVDAVEEIMRSQLQINKPILRSIRIIIGRFVTPTPLPFQQRNTLFVTYCTFNNKWIINLPIWKPDTHTYTHLKKSENSEAECKREIRQKETFAHASKSQNTQLPFHTFVFFYFFPLSLSLFQAQINKSIKILFRPLLHAIWVCSW